MSDEPIIEGAVWRGPLPTEAVHYEVVFVDGIGCIAEATTPAVLVDIRPWPPNSALPATARRPATGSADAFRLC